MSIKDLYTEVMKKRAINRLHRKLYVRVKNAKIKPNMSLPLKRPFTVDELLPLRSDYHIVPPSFIGISSARGGSTWWYNMLLAHPKVVHNRVHTKELCYFYHYFYQRPTREEINTYRQAFAAPKGSLCGEWSPLYLHQPLAMNYLVEAAPDAKFIAMVRNPIHRLRSEINQLHEVFPNAKRLSFPSLANMGEFGRLSQQFKQVLGLVDRKNLLILQYEKCKQNPMQELKKTYRFLGLDESFVPSGLSTEVNTFHTRTDAFEPDVLHNLIKYYQPDVDRLMQMFPNELQPDLWGEFRS
ncbi:MAG: sulfotransferase [Mariprofundaceae bacterium]|nr:sulfotransferase [Mariprofundaceae bacterium]